MATDPFVPFVSPDLEADRPSVLALAIRERGALASAWMPFLRNGGLFIPTNRPARLGESVSLALSLMDDPTRLPISGTVAWISHAGVPGRPQGLGIQLPADVAGAAARTRIEHILGAAALPTVASHTL